MVQVKIITALNKDSLQDIMNGYLRVLQIDGSKILNVTFSDGEQYLTDDGSKTKRLLRGIIIYDSPLLSIPPAAGNVNIS